MLDSLIERFEDAVADHGVESTAPQGIVADWEEETQSKVPSGVITELLRVWLEYRFEAKMPVSPRQAIGLFPRIAFSESEKQCLEFEYQRLAAGPSSSEEVGYSTGRATDALPAVGDTWGDFLLLEQLGEGAFARVYLARQLSMAGRLVALKLTFRATMESQLLARLHHSAIVPIYSMHQHDGVYGLCMPYLGNTTLLDLLREISPAGATNFASIDTADGVELLEILVHRQAKITTIANRASDKETRDRDSSANEAGPGPDADHDLFRSRVESSGQASSGTDVTDTSHVESPAPATPASKHSRLATAKELSKLDYVGAITWIGSQLADALDHAHRHGVLHCDIKPANVLLAPDGQARLLDFNVSLEQDDSIEEARVGGTMAYMAPEHLLAVQGAGKLQIDERSDIYSLGVVLFEMLSGVVPKQHANDEPVTVRQLLQQANSSVTPALAAIVHKCLANEPQDRYASAAQLYDDLNAHCNHLPLVHQPEPSLVERANKWVRRHSLLTSVSSVSMLAACLVAFAFAGFWWRGHRLEQLERASRSDFVQKLLPGAIASVSAVRNYPELRSEALAQTNQVLELLRDESGKSLDLSIVNEKSQLQTLVRLSKSNGLGRTAEELDNLSSVETRDEASGDESSIAPPASDFAERIEQLDAALGAALEDADLVEPASDELLDAYLDGRYTDVLELGEHLPKARANDYAT